MSRSKRREKDTAKPNSNLNPRKEQLVPPKKKLILFPPFVKKVPLPPKKEEKVKVIMFETVDVPVCGEEKFIVDLRKKHIVPCKEVCSVCKDYLERQLIALKDVQLSEEEMEEMEEEEEEALDPEKEEEIKRLKEDYFWTDMCDYPITYPELDESDEVDGTTHRYVSHKIYKEHRKIPRPRHFQRRNKDIYYFVMSLPKKSSSPIRKNPKQFDLEGAYEEWRQKQSEKKEKVILDQSKKRVSDVLKELAEKKKLQDAVTVSVALQAVYDQILLMLMDAKIRTDVHTFINVALIWALSELELSDRDFEQYSDIALTIFGLPEDFMFCSFTRKNILDIVKDGGMRKVLLTVYRVPFSPNIHTTLHPRLPWTYIGPSHQQGHAKFYPNTIERIGEILEYKGTAFDSTYISDVICFHFMDVSEESYIAYRRKIYLFELAGIVDHKLTENLFLQLVHFI